MKNKFKILSLSIICAFVILPFFAVNLDFKTKRESVEVKNTTTTEVKNISIKEKEVAEKKESATKKEDYIIRRKSFVDNRVEFEKKAEKKVEKNKSKVTPKPTLKPTPKPTKKPIKKDKKVNEQKQVVKKNKSAFYLSSNERRILECVVMGEAGGESYKGQLMVTYCIFNACKKDNLQPSQVRRIYKYSGWKTNPSNSVKKAVSAIFDDGYKPVNDTPLYFYAPKYCNSSWHETQRYICTVGGHKFFGRW